MQQMPQLSEDVKLCLRFCDNADNSEKKRNLKKLYTDATSKEIDFLMGRIVSMDLKR